MVMHARKTQRMSDGYFEKHQAHPYQNSKYGSSKSYGDRYEKFRDSPNGNYRSDSPDSSPRDRDRSYASKGAYAAKARDKERENRDYKSSSRDKYSGKRHCARSPKDKRGRDAEHRTNNDRNDDKGVLHVKQTSSRDRKTGHNNCADKRDDSRERAPPRVGDWSEHVSSSGKRYYYNCKTEVSQWEKPREWLDRERERFRRDRDRDRSSTGGDGYGPSGRSGSTRHDKHSNSSRGTTSSSTHNDKRDLPRDSSRHWPSRTDDPPDSKESARSSAGSSSGSTRKQSGDEATQCAQQDMDISPGDSTPTSEVSCANATEAPAATGPVLLAAALPRLASQPEPVPAPAEVEKTEKGPSPVSNAVQVVSEGPPTPTCSEAADGSKAVAPPLSTPTPITIVSTNGAPLAVPAPVPTPVQAPGALQACLTSSLQALRPQGPAITPSLANYYRDDLTAHARGWPADILEKQAAKLAEEAHHTGGVQCAKVSAELKCARSVVRLTEIQATLQEQRILFLRQQIKELEELKSQNSFMSEEP